MNRTRMALGVVALIAAIWLGAISTRAQEGLAGLSRAIGVAERSLGGKAIEGQLETRSGKLVYEVRLARAGGFHRAYIDARSAQLIAVEQPKLEGIYRRWLDGDRIKATRPALAPILMALETHATGRVHKVAMKIHDDVPYYEVEIETANGVAQIAIDAMTGKRLSPAP